MSGQKAERDVIQTFQSFEIMSVECHILCPVCNLQKLPPIRIPSESSSSQSVVRPSLRHSRHTFCWELIKAFRAIRLGQSCCAEQTAVSSQQGYERSSKQRIGMLR